LSQLGLVGFRGKVAPKDIFGHPHHDTATTGAKSRVVVKPPYSLVPGATIGAPVVIQRHRVNLLKLKRLLAEKAGFYETGLIPVSDSR
jgi:hypothetical protein